MAEKLVHEKLSDHIEFGVNLDLNEELRFFIKGNKFVF